MRKALLAAALAAGVGVSATQEQQAHADESIRLETATPAETFVKWEGARSPGADNLVRATIRGRVMHVIASVNVPLALDFGCPPPSSYPGWAVDVTKKAEPGRDSAEIDNTAVERTGENGAYALRTTAPARAGGELTARIDCVKTNGKEEVVDRESLYATITAINGAPGSSTGFFRGTDEADQESEAVAIRYRKRTGPDVEFLAGLGVQAPLSPLSSAEGIGIDWRPVFTAGIRARIAAIEKWRVFAGPDYGFLKLPMTFVPPTGGRSSMYVDTHELALVVEGRYPLIHGAIGDIAVAVSVALGAQYKPRQTTQDGGFLPETVRPTLEALAGLRFQKGIFTAGADATGTFSSSIQQSHAGVEGKFGLAF